ncbi:MAG: ABC transporter permease [Bacillota bacterium]
MSNKYGRLAAGTGILTILVLWQIGSTKYGSVVLPTPLETVRAISALLGEGKLLSAAAVTSARTLAGLALAVLTGTLSGIMAGLHPLADRAVRPLVTMLQGIPPIAWIVLALLWFGTGSATPIFTVAVAVIPITFAGAREGVRTMDGNLLEMARIFQTPPAMLFQDIYLPHLLSYLFPSLVAGLGVAWKVAVMAELMASSTGIGAGLHAARVNLDTAKALAWIAVVVALLSAIEHLCLNPLKRRMEPWRGTPKIT